jgi:hypothetical protein
LPGGRTWTFWQDGKLETQSGVWTFKKGGRIEAHFVRLIGTDTLVVRLAVDGREGRLATSSLSDEDCQYLTGITGKQFPRRIKHVAPRLVNVQELVESKFDSATGQITLEERQPVSLGSAADSKKVNVQAYILANVPQFVAFHFMSRSPSDLGWQYSAQRRVSFVWEDGQKDLGEPRHLGTPGEGYLLEQFTVRCTLNEFKDVAEAQHFEIRVGRDVFKVPYETRAGWRALITMVQEEVAEGNR